MQQRLAGTLRRATGTFSTFSGPQRLIAAIGIAVLLLGGFAFSKWASTPTLVPLFTNLAASDASAIVDELDKQGIKYEISDGGTAVLVPKENVYKLRLTMSAAGLPASSDTGYALLDKQGVTASQFQQQVTFQRALEGELSKTIESIDGVKASTVHLAIPAKDVFSDESKAPTASVLVSSAPGKQLDPKQVQSVVNLVASSVEGMRPEDVTVVDGTGKLLSNRGNSSGGLRDQQTGDYEARVQSAVQEVLDKVAGPGKAVATVTADLNFDNTETTTEKFGAQQNIPPLSSSTSKETYNGAGSPAATGVLGPDNIQVPGGTAAGGNAQYNKESATSNNAVDKTTEHVVAAPGSVRRQSVAVVVDSESASKINLEDLRSTVAAAAGVNDQRGDTMSVTQMPFDTASAKTAAEQLKQADAAENKDRLFSLIKTGIIAAAIVLSVILALLAARRSNKLSRVDDLGELEILLPEPQPALEPAEAKPEPPALPPAPVVPGAAAMRDDVAELVERQPDEVAELLRGWLADRRS